MSAAYCEKCGGVKLSAWATISNTATSIVPMHTCTCSPCPPLSSCVPPLPASPDYIVITRTEYDALRKERKLSEVNRYRHVAEQVAKVESTFTNETNGSQLCPFCNGWQTEADAFIRKKPFPHQPGCIVVIARALVTLCHEQPQADVK